MDKLSLYFITWNVATRPPGESVRNLLDLGRFPVNELPDFYFIGLQEVKSQPQNFVLDALLEDPWTKAFKNALAPHDYVKVKTVRMVGIMLNVFCLRKHLTNLRSMETQITRTGLMGLWGNKGATSLRLQIYGVNLCVVNAHLAPHDHQLKQRINDYNTIIREQTFQADHETSKILYHDYVFWMGDLNFRLNNPDGTFTMDHILQKIKDVAYDDLLAEDQLVQVMKSGEAFSEFNETKPAFQPTYKYQFGSHNYDQKRRSAWTDRILYKVNENNYEDVKLSLEQLKYNSLQDYGTSDHKPVLSEFKIKICPSIFADGCLPSPIDSDRRRKRNAHVSLSNVAIIPIDSWKLDERNNVTINFGADFQPNGWDWIGIYHENFSSLDDYLCYIYVPVPVVDNFCILNLEDDNEGRVDLTHNDRNDLGEDSNRLEPSTSFHSRGSNHSQYLPQSKDFLRIRKSSNNCRPTATEENQTGPTTSSLPSSPSPRIESLVISFPETAIRYPGSYRLVYFTKNSSDVLGVSNCFQAIDKSTDLNKSYNLDW